MNISTFQARFLTITDDPSVLRVGTVPCVPPRLVGSQTVAKVLLGCRFGTLHNTQPYGVRLGCLTENCIAKTSGPMGRAFSRLILGLINRSNRTD